MSASPSGYLQPRRGLAWRWAAVLLLHLGLLLFFSQVRQASLHGQAQATSPARTVTVQLFKPRPSHEAPVAARARILMPPSRAARSRQPAIEPAAASPSLPSAASPEDPAAAPAPPAETHSARAAPLLLTLPSRAASGALPSMAEMVRRDARANSRRLSVEERMASALGNAEVSEEQIKAGHTRFRQGSSCIDVQDLRIGQLQPFDAVARGAPRLVSSCKK